MGYVGTVTVLQYTVSDLCLQLLRLSSTQSLLPCSHPVIYGSLQKAQTSSYLPSKRAAARHNSTNQQVHMASEL